MFFVKTCQIHRELKHGVMKTKRLKLMLPGLAACLAAGFHLVSTQPNRSIPVDAVMMAPVPKPGAGVFREVLYLGDDRDDPKKKPAAAYDRLLASYGG